MNILIIIKPTDENQDNNIEKRIIAAKLNCNPEDITDCMVKKYFSTEKILFELDK